MVSVVERLRQAEAVLRQRRDLERVRRLGSDALQLVAITMNHADLDSLYAAVGEAHVSARSVAHVGSGLGRTLPLSSNKPTAMTVKDGEVYYVDSSDRCCDSRRTAPRSAGISKRGDPLNRPGAPSSAPPCAVRPSA